MIIISWRQTLAEAIAVTAEREGRGLVGPLINKRNTDEWRIRRRISRRHKGKRALRRRK